MKKVLSIVLSIVMVLCMMPAMAFAGTADFTDAADIEYTEAVDVLYAAGIIDGMPDGSFVPNGNVTREQAAKLIATVMLGDKAEKLVADVAPFSDVAADRWSAGYIAYCVEKGIVDGVGEGKFDPTGNVTALQLAKMLLVVAGYDADIEGMTGTNWAANTSALAAELELFKGNDAVLENQPASREESALYILNVLGDYVVSYRNKGTAVTLPDGTTVVSGASEARATANTVIDKYNVDLVLSTSSKADDFGRPANVWSVKSTGKTIGTYQTATPVLTYTTSVVEKDLFAALGAEGIGAGSKYVVMDEIWVDGVQVAASKAFGDEYDYDSSLPTRDARYDESVEIVKGSTTAVRGPGEGVTTEIYKVKANHYKMVIVKEYLAKVGTPIKADVNANVGRKINLQVFGVANTTFETDSFVKDDMVLVTMANGVVKTVKLAEKVENVAVTAYSDSYVTFNGVPHKYSQEHKVDAKSYTMTGNATYTFYLDSCGNVIEAIDYTAATNKGYVLITAYASPETDKWTKAVTQEIKYLDVNGVEGTAKLVGETIKSDNEANYLDIWHTVAPHATVDGCVTISSMKNVDTADHKWYGGTTAGISNTKPTMITNVVANADTKFIVKTHDAKDNDVYTAYTGIANIPSYTATTSFVVRGMVSDGFATAVFVDASSIKTDATATDVVYLLEDETTETATVNSKQYWVYDVVALDGTPGTIKADSNKLEALNPGFVKIAKYDVDGIALEANMTQVANNDESELYNVTAKGVVDFASNTLKIGTDAFSTNDATAVYVVKGTTVTKSDFATIDEKTVTSAGVVYASKTDKTVKAVFIVEATA